MSGKGNPNNAPMETLRRWGTLVIDTINVGVRKQELVVTVIIEVEQEAIRISAIYRVFYNRQRRQARLGLSPRRVTKIPCRITAA